MKVEPEPPQPTYLLIEDFEPDRYVFQKAFRDAAVCGELVTADSAEEALERMQGGLRPALILLDYVLPRKNGEEFVDALRADPHLRSIPVLVISAMVQPSVVARMYDLGVAAYVQKPSGFAETTELARRIFGFYCHPGVITEPMARAADRTGLADS